MPYGYPAFSKDEYRRRYEAVAAILRDHGAEGVIVYDSQRVSGSFVQYLSNFPTTTEAVLVLRREPEAQEKATLFVQLYNHVPAARRIAVIDDVRWGGPNTAETVARHLVSRRLNRGRVGLVGRIPYQIVETWRQALPDVEWVDLTSAFLRLRLIKSEEEMEWVRKAARLTDASLRALQGALKPGLTEEQLPRVLEEPYLDKGGRNNIHYVLTTSMANPEVCVPSQYPSDRVLQAGDVLVIENSADYWGYTAQILRTFTIGAEPTPLYRELHAVAVEAYRRIRSVLRAGATAEAVVAAADIIPESGFTIYDDLFHGYVGGYLEPVLRTRDQLHRPIPDFTFAEGMTVVIQPNVITKDEKAGVQVGQLVRIAADGVEDLHDFPLELVRC